MYGSKELSLLTVIKYSKHNGYGSKPCICFGCESSIKYRKRKNYSDHWAKWKRSARTHKCECPFDLNSILTVVKSWTTSEYFISVVRNKSSLVSIKSKRTERKSYIEKKLIIESLFMVSVHAICFFHSPQKQTRALKFFHFYIYFSEFLLTRPHRIKPYTSPNGSDRPIFSFFWGQYLSTFYKITKRKSGTQLYTNILCIYGRYNQWWR